MKSLGLSSALLLLLLFLRPPTSRGECSSPGRIENAVIKDEEPKDSYPVGTNLTYRCLPGYQRIMGTSLKLTCSDASKWLPESPQFCEARRCTAPNLENGRFESMGDLRLGDEITFTCDDGYRLIGDNTARCTVKSGTVGWNNLPTCQLIPCFPPPPINNGSVFGDFREEYAIGSAVTYSCDKGYSLIGSKTLTCIVAADGENGVWDSPQPECKVVQCRRPEIDHGSVSAHRPLYSYENSLTVTCDAGYRLSGKNLIKCGADSEWLPPVPKCDLVPEPTGSTTVIAPTTVPSGDETVPAATKTPKEQPATTKSPTDESGSSSKLGIIIGCVIGVVLLITGVCTAFLYYRANRKKGKMDTRTSSPNAYSLVSQKRDPALPEKDPSQA